MTERVEAKQRLRARIRARFEHADRADLAEAAARASAHLVATAAWARAQQVGLYAAMADELPTAPVVAAAQRAGKALLWPRVAGDTLEFVACAEDALVSSAFGIPAPPADEPAAVLHAGTLVLVPGRAFDAAGRRLGRGRGFYDRLLALPERGPAFGWAVDWQRVPEVPVEAHDQPVDAVVTECGVFEAPRAAPEAR